MYDYILEDTIFIMLYAVVMAMAAMASIYLLFRRGNAFAADITPPLRLRRWTAAFLAVNALGHLWYLPATMFTSSEEVMLSMLTGALLDCLLTIPLSLVVMLCMLQDRRRPLWPVAVMMAPLVLGVVVCIVTRSNALLPWLRGYYLLAAVGFTVYMVRAVRQYGRWLRDNFADLEHKEVWQIFAAMAFILLMFAYYVSGIYSIVYEYIIQVCDLLLIVYLLWRVETLSSLTPASSPNSEESDDTQGQETNDEQEKIASLLQQHCVDTQLYLQHNLNISQLAQALGTNRTYLGQYFAYQDTNYNAYINDLRIRHFIRLYSEAVADQRFYTVQQLATQSGYRSYNTFALAFKQRMGKSVTEWKQEDVATGNFGR